MGRAEETETKQVLRALKDWVNDTPLRIRGWVMLLIAFIGGLIISGTWLSKNLPPWYVWLAIALIIIGVIGLSFIPYYKRLKAQKLSDITGRQNIRAAIKNAGKIKIGRNLDINVKGDADGVRNTGSGNIETGGDFKVNKSE
jgi:hypothetical protein